MAYRARQNDRYTAIIVVVSIYLLMVIVIALAYVFVPQDKPQTYYIEYTVKWGDTLWEIGQEYGVNAEQLARDNRLYTNVLMPGDKLIIPVATIRD